MVEDSCRSRVVQALWAPHRNFNLTKTESERTQLAAVIGSDGRRLLQAIAVSNARDSLGKLDEIILLERIWEEQFVEENGQLRFREVKDMASPATLITSPYDHEARYSTKRRESWVGTQSAPYRELLRRSSAFDYQH